MQAILQAVLIIHINVAAVQSQDCCESCGKLASSMSQCQMCLMSRFCSRACQRKAWRDHKHVCHDIKTANSIEWMTTDRLHAPQPSLLSSCDRFMAHLLKVSHVDAMVPCLCACKRFRLRRPVERRCRPRQLCCYPTVCIGACDKRLAVQESSYYGCSHNAESCLVPKAFTASCTRDLIVMYCKRNFWWR